MAKTFFPIFRSDKGFAQVLYKPPPECRLTPLCPSTVYHHSRSNRSVHALHTLTCTLHSWACLWLTWKALGFHHSEQSHQPSPTLSQRFSGIVLKFYFGGIQTETRLVIIPQKVAPPLWLLSQVHTLNTQISFLSCHRVTMATAHHL